MIFIQTINKIFFKYMYIVLNKHFQGVVVNIFKTVPGLNRTVLGLGYFSMGNLLIM